MRSIDRHFAAKNRRVVVILDNVPAHITLDNLAVVKLGFLPPNIEIAQPLDQGIIRAQVYKEINNVAVWAVPVRHDKKSKHTTRRGW